MHICVYEVMLNFYFFSMLFIIILGVVGKSVKGHPSVFVSSDAGVTWREVSLI